jgi:hypothetical protein
MRKVLNVTLRVTDIIAHFLRQANVHAFPVYLDEAVTADYTVAPIRIEFLGIADFLAYAIS